MRSMEIFFNYFLINLFNLTFNIIIYFKKIVKYLILNFVYKIEIFFVISLIF